MDASAVVGLAPVRIGRHGDLAVDEHEALASVLVDTDRQSVRPRTRRASPPAGRRGSKPCADSMAEERAADADHLACVGDSAIELLLGHIATLTEQR